MTERNVVEEGVLSAEKDFATKRKTIVRDSGPHARSDDIQI